MRTGLRIGIMSLYRDFVMRTGITAREEFSVYNYMFYPHQLRFLMDCIQDTANVPGCCAEVGCAKGNTTAFLKKWMDSQGIEKTYVALDTFSGFVAGHSDHEVKSRGKPSAISTLFTLNKREWFDYSMKLANVTNVVSIQTDAAKFDFDSLFPISFCLLDVDLYLPIRYCLPNIYRNMSPGGIIVVDDCQPENIYDGALQAYQEFIKSLGVPQRIECGKLGVIRKA
jgi:O-methyltransferase